VATRMTKPVSTIFFRKFKVPQEYTLGVRLMNDSDEKCNRSHLGTTTKAYRGENVNTDISYNKSVTQKT